MKSNFALWQRRAGLMLIFNPLNRTFLTKKRGTLFAHFYWQSRSFPHDQTFVSPSWSRRVFLVFPWVSTSRINIFHFPAKDEGGTNKLSACFVLGAGRFINVEVQISNNPAGRDHLSGFIKITMIFVRNFTSVLIRLIWSSALPALVLHRAMGDLTLTSLSAEPSDCSLMEGSRLRCRRTSSSSCSKPSRRL